MNVFFLAALNLFALTIPSHLLAYFPFRSCLRFAPWKVTLSVGVIQTIQAAFYGYCIASGSSGQFAKYSFYFIYMAVYFFCMQDQRPKLMFLYLFVTDYVAILGGTAAFLNARFFYREDMVFYSLRNTLLIVAVFFLTFPFMLRFFIHARDQAFRVEAPLFWRTAWLLPAFTTLIVLVFTMDFSPQSVYSLRFFLARMLLILCMFVIYFILLQSLDGIRKQAALTEQAAMQEHLMAAWKLQYRQLLDHMEETKTARHDLRQHLGVIRVYAAEGENTKLLEYLNAYESMLPSDTRKVFCSNFAVNAVLTYYAEKAMANGITFDACCPLPETLPAKEPEVCALIGNLLENAIDACSMMLPDKPFIRVHGECSGKKLVFTIDNSCPKEPLLEQGRFVSAKHKGYGTGTYSVKTTAEKNGGTAKFEYKDHVFYASVLLYGNLEEDTIL